MAKKGKRKKRGEPASGAAAPAAPAGSPAVAASEAAARASRAADTEGVTAGAIAATPRSTRPTALANAFIALFLAYQLAMPLRYYLSDSRHDERFSWRMFSSVRMQQCKVAVHEQASGQERRVDLRKEVQVAWIGMLERYRLPVVDKFLARRCAEPGVTEVRFTRTCTDTDGTALPDTTRERACAAPGARTGKGSAAR